jgi:hypothetical protein
MNTKQKDISFIYYSHISILKLDYGKFKKSRPVSHLKAWEQARGGSLSRAVPLNYKRDSSSWERHMA